MFLFQSHYIMFDVLRVKELLDELNYEVTEKLDCGNDKVIDLNKAVTKFLS